MMEAGTAYGTWRWMAKHHKEAGGFPWVQGTLNRAPDTETVYIDGEPGYLPLGSSHYLFEKSP